MPEEGGPEGPWSFPVFGRLVTLFQPGGGDYAHHIITGPPRFLEGAEALPNICLGELKYRVQLVFKNSNQNLEFRQNFGRKSRRLQLMPIIFFQEAICKRRPYDRFWDPDRCECRCKNELECSTNLQFDPSTCRYVSTRCSSRFFVLVGHETTYYACGENHHHFNKMSY